MLRKKFYGVIFKQYTYCFHFLLLSIGVLYPTVFQASTLEFSRRKHFDLVLEDLVKVT